MTFGARQIAEVSSRRCANRSEQRRDYFNIRSSQSRIANDLTNLSKMNGSCLVNASAASRVLKMANSPGRQRADSDNFALGNEGIDNGFVSRVDRHDCLH
jgi:hypothetical protein